MAFKKKEAEEISVQPPTPPTKKGKTIEIVSTVKGIVSICTNAGDSRQIMFEDKGDVGVALVDNDEAEALLRLPAFWKPTYEA